MIKIKEAIVVEGRYDKNTLSQIFDAVIVETGGFQIFKNTEKLAYLRRLAETRGLLILTDSDQAGFLIRGHLKGAIDPKYIKQAYIPDIFGKEKRKAHASKEGKLGVEGMDRATLIESLRRAGATVDDMPAARKNAITKARLFADGLNGTANSSERRQKLLKSLGLPTRLTGNGLLDALNSAVTMEDYERAVAELDHGAEK